MRNGLLKKQLKKICLRDNAFWIWTVTMLVIVCGDILGLKVIPQISKDESYMYTLMSYLGFLPMWISTIFVITVFKKNRYIYKCLLINTKGNTILNLLVGLLMGFLLNGLCGFVSWVCGDIKLNFVGFDLIPVLGLFIAVFIQSSAEEAVCRGFMYQRLLKSNPKPIFAIVVNSLFFAFLHLSNNGINIIAFYDLFVTGVFFSLIVYYFDSLWMVMGIHTTWNFTQSILLGLPNSGASFPYSIYRLDANSVYSGFAYNNEFGLEGTILSSTLMTICCIMVYIVKCKEKKDLWFANK
ncbi:CPBP family intramembrane glutamic endopeptidase [Enterococcus faecalis]|uniref:CPBP family intramembrane glutamic endopeptidase n=1 Tax=Enterococcus faecalis TaxID=1351 RepID=UPI0009AF5611|nr:CPBP family intramembrane glutamic endopeptidase [Enterococcus faecalis]